MWHDFLCYRNKVTQMKIGSIKAVLLDHRPISLHTIFEFWISEFISNLEKNRVQNQLDFFSSLNLISTACVACKNQFRNQIDFSVFLTWYFEIEKYSSDTRYLKNRVEIDRGHVYFEYIFDIYLIEQ